MVEQFAKANGIDICYETEGDPSNPAMLLVMGLGAQMTRWDPGLVTMLAERGFYVIKFDNRDVGKSSKIEGGPRPDFQAVLRGDTSSASYTLWDMADDAAGLLEALGIAKAHIVGASLGGMVAQAIAIRHPEKVLSLCSIMSTTGNGDVGKSNGEAMAVLTRPPAKSREEAVEAAASAAQLMNGSKYTADLETVRERAGADYDRCFYPVGTARQLVSVGATGDRTEALKGVTAPTVVIHGAEDPLVGVSGGEATAAAIPGSRLLILEGVGHAMPQGAWPEIVEAIVENAARVDVGVQSQLHRQSR